jgi:hypothetical protein
MLLLIVMVMFVNYMDRGKSLYRCRVRALS